MTATATPSAERISSFASAVREAMNDLPADEVDELVEGLEADLLEQEADREIFDPGDPVAYADELRAAAGLPQRQDPSSKRLAVAELWSEFRKGSQRRIRSNWLGGWLLDTMIALRPIWWVARGWALYAMVAPMLGAASDVFFLPGANLGGWMLLAALLLVSVQWGRGYWAGTRWLVFVRIAVSTVTAITLPFLIAAAGSSVNNVIAYAYAVENTVVPGMAMDGESVHNIYAYDAEGSPIEVVQLFDQNGRPITTVSAYQDSNSRWDERVFGSGEPVPVVYDNGRESAWNVFPLSEMPADSWTDATPDPNAATIPPFPFIRVPALSGLAAPGSTPAPAP